MENKDIRKTKRNVLFTVIGLLGLTFVLAIMFFANRYDDPQSDYLSPMGEIEARSERQENPVFPTGEVAYDQRDAYLEAAMERRDELSAHIVALEPTADEENIRIEQAQIRLNQLDSLLAQGQEITQSQWTDYRQNVDNFIYEIAALLRLGERDVDADVYDGGDHTIEGAHPGADRSLDNAQPMHEPAPIDRGNEGQRGADGLEGPSAQ
jgi:hypothetical protein